MFKASFKYIVFPVSVLSLHYAHSMEQAKISRMRFAQATEICAKDDNRELVRQYLEQARDLNVKVPARGYYPVQHLFLKGFDSDLIALALKNGARPDLTSNPSGYTLFHYIARERNNVSSKKNIFLRQNLLAAFVLPTYCYDDAPEVAEVLSEAELNDKALRSPCSVVNTFLMCLKKPEYARFKDVKPFVLKYLIDASCSQLIFNKTLRFLDNPEQLITRFPFARFARLAQTKDDHNDREKFVALYAPLFARYRLTQAYTVLQATDVNDCTAYDSACERAGIAKLLGDTRAQWQVMVDDLQPDLLDGFIDRHINECTRIIKNILLGCDPFDGFTEFGKGITTQPPTRS